MRRTAARTRGFTLVEIMIALSIAAIVFAIGIPAVFRLMHKDPMRQGLSDILKAFDEARGEAILKDTPTAVQFNLLDGGVWEIVVSEASRMEQDRWDGGGAVSAGADPGTPAAGKTLFQARLSDQLRVQVLGVNFKDAIADQEPPAPVHFFPNGTCDEFALVLCWPERQQWRKITLDVITGFPDVEVIRCGCGGAAWAPSPCWK
jgi:prepilin-type N-terminal cleavage/methylation domain-containing protein